MKRILGVVVLCALAACPAPQQAGGGGGGGGGGRAGISPDSCGKLDTTNIGRKVYQFLIASAELDRASLELERSVHDACKRMAVELGVSPAGTIQEVCTRAATELDANLKVSVKSESRLVTRTVPPVCTTSVEFTAGVVASCEAKASADVDVTCTGRCGGTCSGACDGTCAGAAGGNAGTAQCNGQCQGTCRGRCTGGCDGYVDVNASAECKASAEIRAVTHTECTEAKVEVVRENVTVVDDSKFQKAVAAINAGMPAIVKAGVKLERAGKAVGLWVTTGASLVKASGQLVGELGEKAVCVGGQLAAVVGATANIQARFSVSIEVSAKVSASAGAQSR
jgi:hypothetical protein